MPPFYLNRNPKVRDREVEWREEMGGEKWVERRNPPNSLTNITNKQIYMQIFSGPLLPPNDPNHFPSC